MKQSSKRIVSILVSLLLVVVALIVFFDIVQPEYGSVAQIKGTIVAENQILQTETQAVAAVQSIITQYQQDSQAQQTLALALPPREDVAGALAQIYGIAENNGLGISNIAVASPVLQAVVSSTAADAAATAKPIGSISFQITSSGSYESFENFLADLETNVRMFDVKALTIAPGTELAVAGSSKSASVGSTNFFSYTITVATYYQTN